MPEGLDEAGAQRWETNAHFATELGADEGGFWPLKQAVADCLTQRMEAMQLAPKSGFLFPEFTLKPDGTIAAAKAEGSDDTLGAIVKDCIQSLSADLLKENVAGEADQVIDWQIQLNKQAEGVKLTWFF